MRQSAGSHGVVQLAALDLRRRPDHAAELTSQLLMGEVVRVRSRTANGQWCQVENEADGYVGWTHAYGLRFAGRTRVRRWLALARGRITVPFTEVRSGPRGGHVLTPLFWNGRVIPGRASGSRRRVELPDGRRGWLAVEAMQTGGPPVPLLARIRDLLGTPYLWGGRTPHGFDCSGLVQQLMAEQGIALPRDAHDQYLVTRAPLEPGELRLGDLIFFSRGRGRAQHVAMALGGGFYVHARGSVRVNAMDSTNPFYDKPLSRQLLGFGRAKHIRLARVFRGHRKREPA